MKVGPHSCEVDSFIWASSAGWTTGFRSIYWYQTASTYLTVAFGNVTVVTSVLLVQLSANGYTTPFSKFQISFSDDGISYAFLPEVSVPVTTSACFDEGSR